jgi:hypothetical protein
MKDQFVLVVLYVPSCICVKLCKDLLSIIGDS